MVRKAFDRPRARIWKSTRLIVILDHSNASAWHHLLAAAPDTWSSRW